MKCRRCLSDNSVRKIQFDSDGVCNYCRNYQTLESRLKDYRTLEELFEERIERVRGEHAYDAAVGISGGKDSTFVLHQLIYRYRLKVKTFTLDNGFLSDAARVNIDKTVGDFGVEHEYITFDPEILRKFYRYSMKKWLVPCIACSYLGYATMINYASKIDAGVCIHGRSPEQMLRSYGTDVFTSLVDAGLKSIREVDINSLYGELLKSIEDKVDKELMRDIKGILFKDLKENDFREFVAYFLYHPYDENEIVEFLQREISWQKGENHYDCLVHNAAKYIYQCAEGRPHALPEISVSVRSGKISRQEAERLLSDEVLSEKPSDEIKLLCKLAKINPTVLLMKAKLYRKFTKR